VTSRSDGAGREPIPSFERRRRASAHARRSALPRLSARHGHKAEKVRWAVIEAVQRIPQDTPIGAVKDAIITRRGKEARNIAKVAAARRLLTLACYGLRDGQIRCLTPAAQPPARAA